MMQLSVVGGAVLLGTMTCSFSAHAQDAEIPVPRELHGKWTISSVLPANTITCWDDDQANAILGTVIEYSAGGFQWNDINIESLGVSSTTVNASDFESDNSGSGSSVSFADLGIGSEEVQQIAIDHTDVTWMEGSTTGTEIPGENVLLKADDAIVFSVCNVYFEANRD